MGVGELGSRRAARGVTGAGGRSGGGPVAGGGARAGARAEGNRSGPPDPGRGRRASPAVRAGGRKSGRPRRGSGPPRGTPPSRAGATPGGSPPPSDRVRRAPPPMPTGGRPASAAGRGTSCRAGPSQRPRACARRGRAAVRRPRGRPGPSVRPSRSSARPPRPRRRAAARVRAGNPRARDAPPRAATGIWSGFRAPSGALRARGGTPPRRRRVRGIRRCARPAREPWTGAGRAVRAPFFRAGSGRGGTSEGIMAGIRLFVKTQRTRAHLNPLRVGIERHGREPEPMQGLRGRAPHPRRPCEASFFPARSETPFLHPFCGNRIQGAVLGVRGAEAGRTPILQIRTEYCKKRKIVD